MKVLVFVYAAVALAWAGVRAELVETGSVACDFPNEPQFLQPPVCPPTTLTRENATSLAWQFAPEMRFHSLEESFMLDPSTYFEQASLFAPTFVFDEPGPECDVQADSTCEIRNQEWRNLTDVWNAQRTTAMFLQNSWLTSLLSTDLTERQKDALLVGDSFDADGLSTSNMTFTLETAQDGNAWILTFHQFYAWNGCSNQALATRLGKQYDVLQYYMCPDGTHEGDWEHVGLYICPADLEAPNATPRSAIRRVHYSQHGWLQEYDCGQQGHCPFEEDAQSDSKLVAYAGLFSHANYPKASDLWVYSATSLGFLENLDGLYVADRTQGTATAGRRWVPTAQNVRYLPPAEDITDDSLDKWALYPGSWGAGDVFLDDQRRLICFEDNFTATGECEEGSSFELLSRILGASSVANTSQATQQASASSTADFGNRILGAAHRTGPLQREYTYKWLEERPAPIWEQLTDADDTTALVRSEMVCPASRDIGAIDVITDDFRRSTVVPALVGILAGTLALALAVGLLLMLTVRFRQGTPTHNLLSERLQHLVLSDRRRNGKEVPRALEEECEKSSSRATIRGWIAPVTAIALFIVGVILGSIAMVDLFDALDDLYASDAWNGFFELIVTLFVLGLLVDVLIVVALTRANPRRPTFAQVCCACCMPGRRSTSRGALREHMAWNALFAILVVLQLALTVGLFSFGFMLLIARTLLSEGCTSVLELINGILDNPDAGTGGLCLDLSPVGLSTVACGRDVVDFCNTWAGVRAGFVLWGGYCILLSHLIMLQLLYQRGHTLGLLLGLERLDERLNGSSGGDDGAARGGGDGGAGWGFGGGFFGGGGGKRGLNIRKNGSAEKKVGKGGVAWTVGKPTAADRLMSSKVSDTADDKLAGGTRASQKSPLTALQVDTEGDQRSPSTPKASPRQHLAHKTDWEPIVLTPKGGPPGANSRSNAVGPAEDQQAAKATSNGAGGHITQHVELSPRSQQNSMGNAFNVGVHGAASSNDEALQEHSLALALAQSNDAEGTVQQNNSSYNSPELSRMTSGGAPPSNGGSWFPVSAGDQYSTMSNRTEQQHALARLAVPSAGGHSTMSGASPGMHQHSSQASPSFSRKRDAAVQYGAPESPAHARQNPLFVHAQSPTSPVPGNHHSIQQEYTVPTPSQRGAPRDAGVQFAGAGSSLNSNGVPDSPPRRKGPQPRGLQHLQAGSQRQDPSDPGFKQMYSPSNPPRDTGTWTPRGKGFVTII